MLTKKFFIGLFSLVLFLGQTVFAATGNITLSAADLYKKNVPSVLFLQTQDGTGSGVIL